MRSHVVFLCAVVIAATYCLFLSKTSFFSLPYLKSIDYLLSFRYKYDKMPDIIKKIVVVDIDEASLDKIQQRWPIDRSLYAAFLKNVSRPESKPAVIGIDIAFIGKSDKPESDMALAMAIKEADNVILGTYFDTKHKLILPEQMFIESSRGFGCLNYPRDKDYIIRRARPFILHINKADSCLVLKTALFFRGLDPQRYSYNKEKGVLKFASSEKGSLTLPVNPRNRTTRINYFAKFRDFKVIPFWETIDLKEPPETFKDKIVLLGTATELLHDIYPTPLGLMPGITINANFLMSILLNRYLAETPLPIYLLAIFLASFLVIFTTLRSNNLKGFAILIALVAASLAISLFCIKNDIVVDYFGITLASIFSFLGAVIFKYFSIIYENSRLSSLAVTDTLTGLYCQRYFDVKINSEMRIASDLKQELSLAVFEIEKLQDYNNKFGYECGNEIMKSVAAAIKHNSRPTDTVARIEGARIAVILSLTNFDGAGKYAEKIKRITEGLNISCNENRVKINLKSGISSLTKISEKSPAALTEQALKDVGS